MKGSLSEGVLPGLMRELYVGRKTGLLHFTQGKERRSVRFRRGNIVNAETNVAADYLGEILVRKGLLSGDDLDRATQVVLREKKRLGQALIELGVMDREQLEDAMAFQVHEILAKVFAWNEGAYEFEELPEPTGEEGVTLRLSTGELILEAVRQVQDPDVIRYALGDIDRVVALSSDPLLRFQNITLSPSDGFLLSRVDGMLSAREITKLVPLPTPEAHKGLFGLLCTGIIEYQEAAPKRSRPEGRGASASRVSAPPPAVPRPATPPPPPPPAPSRVPAPPAPGPAAPPQTAPPASPPSPPPPVSPPSAAPPRPSGAAPGPGGGETGGGERRDEILEAYQTLKTKSHFEILGIPRASTEAQVKEAYFRLAKRFHPDVHHAASLSDLRDKLEAVFIRLGEAYEVLRNPRTRASYEETLGRSPAWSAGPGPAPPPGTPPAPAPLPPAAAAPAHDSAAELRSAELGIRQAEKHFEREKYWDAIQLLEPAVEVVQGKPRQKARVLLARAYLKNPKWVKRAEEVLLSVVHDDPGNLDALLILGRIYKSSGLKSRSVAMLKKVLELKPDHEEARAELGDQPPEPEEPGGLLRKLFKKG